MNDTIEGKYDTASTVLTVPSGYSFRDEYLLAIPKLRKYAISLCGRTARAEDVLQEALLKMWANQDSFRADSSMLAWGYTILRNEYYSEYRKRRHEVGDEEGRHAARLASRPTQEDSVYAHDVFEKIELLSPDHREALILVELGGLSYAEAAAESKCAEGTIKSRLNRARQNLKELLSFDYEDTGVETGVTKNSYNPFKRYRISTSYPNLGIALVQLRYRKQATLAIRLTADNPGMAPRTASTIVSLYFGMAGNLSLYPFDNTVGHCVKAILTEGGIDLGFAAAMADNFARDKPAAAASLQRKGLILPVTL